MIRFAIASLSPVADLLAACLWGGIWPTLALVHVTLVVWALDRWSSSVLPVYDTPASLAFGHRLTLVLGGLHFPLLALGVWSLADAGTLDFGQKLALGLALGLYLGQVGNSNAHELIHAPDRWSRRLGKAVFISLLFGHHASAHPRVHHVHVASDDDPNSARLGQGFYRFWPRAWTGSFRAGWRAETAARSRQTPRPSVLSHPYLVYCGGALATLAVSHALAGATGVAMLIALAGYAQMQLLLADYIQHYGLRRVRRPDGRLQPAGPQHSWNAPHWYSSAMMLNAPRHSDHHDNPARRFPALRLDAQTMPVWPHAMPVMAALALCPPLWRRRMDPLAARWQTRIVSDAGLGPREHGSATADLPL